MPGQLAQSQPQSVLSSRLQKQPTSLFDFITDWRFEHFLTPWLIRVLWIVCLVFAAFSIVGAAYLAFGPAPQVVREPMKGAPKFRLPTSGEMRIIAFFVQVFVIVVGVIAVRVWCEMTIVVFNIANTLKSIDRKG